MIPFRKSLAFAVLVMTIILLPLPLLVDAFIYLHGRYKADIHEIKSILVLEARMVLFKSSGQLKVKQRALDLIEFYLNLKNDFPKESNQSLTEEIKNLAKVGKFAAFLLLKKENDHYVTLASNIESKEEMSLLEDAVNNQLTKKDFSILLEFKERYLLVHAKKIISDDGQELGALLYANDVTESLYHDFQMHPFSGVPAYFAILNQNFIITFSLDNDFQYQYLFPLSKKEIEAFEKAKNLKSKLREKPLSITFDQGNPFVTFEWRGKKWIGNIQKFPESDFYLLSYIPENQILFPKLKSVIKLYGIYILIIIIGGILSILSTLRIARPLKNLSITMEEIQKGNLQKRYKNDPLGFEINFLGQTFNHMIDTLLEKQNQVAEERVKTERYNKELLIGQEIQRSLLTEKMPFYEGIDLDARYIPAKEVGGDFYDVFIRQLTDEELVLVVADASGKGVGACFYSLGVRSYLRTFAHHFSKISDFMEKSNALFAPDCGESGMFVTTFVAIYNNKSKILSWSSCGHPPMFILKNDGTLETLSERAMALGVDETMKVIEKQVRLNTGDLVFLYTDGVTDDQNEAGELYGEERLKTFVIEHGKKDIHEISDLLISKLRDFQGKALQYDDITLLLMRVL